MTKKTDSPLSNAILALADQLEDGEMKTAIHCAVKGKASPAVPPRPEVVSGEEAARLLRLTRRTIAGLARSGIVQRVQLPGRTRSIGYLRSSVEALLAKGE